uniref:AN1-type domain-containing protein n=1 Tax=Spongospora subterranea TaxID=70186 RepID=A0A0H5REA3_9EUKA|eukprot:CRZ12091.1 hypothetical protein [Spongospora subterranea]
MEFVNVGAHCADQVCRQQDFIPFQCDGCHKWFCLHHRTYKSHHCPNALQKSLHIVLCPLCDQTFRVYHEQQPDAIVNEHIRMNGCQTHRRKVAIKRKNDRCRAKGCQASALTFKCQLCQKAVCVNHRFPEDHSCSNSRATASTSAPTTSFCTIS